MRRLCETMFVYVMSVILKESHWLSVIYVLCISGGQSVQVIYGGGGGGCFISLREPLLSPQMPVNIDWAPYLTVTAKCHIRILEHFILSTLCHMISPLVCQDQDQDHPWLCSECDILLLRSPGRPVRVSESPRSHSGVSSHLSHAGQWGDMTQSRHNQCYASHPACGEITLRDQQKIPE